MSAIPVQAFTIPAVQELETVAASLAAPLGIEIAPDWLNGIAQQLQISLQMAQMLDAVPLPDESEPAPVYRL